MGRSRSVDKPEKELLNPEETADMCGGEDTLRDFRNAEPPWLVPRIKKNRKVRYLTIEVRAACRRLLVEPYPDSTNNGDPHPGGHSEG